MWRHRRTEMTIAPLLAGLMLVATASVSAAQGGSRPLFEWNGRVDNEVQITMRGRNVWTRAIGPTDERLPGPDIMSPLPAEDGVVRVRLDGGLGEVQVIQQPGVDNDHTVIIRVRDRSNSGEINRVRATWLPYATSRGEVVEREDVLPRGPYGAERIALRWTGRVDDALEIRIRGERISYRTLSGDDPDEVNARVVNFGLPIDATTVRIHPLIGRGTVHVVQQPTEENNFTAIVRIYDPQPRMGRYEFDLTVRN